MTYAAGYLVTHPPSWLAAAHALATLVLSFVLGLLLQWLLPRHN